MSACRGDAYVMTLTHTVQTENNKRRRLNLKTLIPNKSDAPDLSHTIINKDEAKHGRHDTHIHHDTMYEIVLGQELPDNVKDNHRVDLVDNQVKEINPHSKILNTYQIDEYDDCVDEDIHIITAPLNI
ncbi:hypothetical protein QTP88_006106 [Uroleucon formosanum]